MTKDEILTWFAVKHGRVCVDRSALPEWGQIRAVTLCRPAQVEVAFMSNDADEGGPTYWANAETLDAAIEAVADYLGKTIEEWENFSTTGRYPEPADRVLSYAELCDAVRENALPLPKGLHFRLREKHWRNVARANLDPHEYEVVGRWESVGDDVRGDAACERIERLVANVLQELGTSESAGGGDTLYRDPADGRLWERTIPQSHLSGGGPPILATISEDEAIAKYGRVVRRLATRRHDDP